MNISFDFDGVLSMTPFGRMAVHAPRPVADLPEAYERLYEGEHRTNRLRLAVEYARFGWRRMAPDAAPVLTELLDAGHQCWIVTGRSEQGIALLHRWLRRSGLQERVGVRMAPPGLRPPQHKLAVAKMLGIDAHIDDDPRTAYHLARSGVPHVYLLDHAGAHGDAPLPEHLELVRSLREFARLVAAV
jgi:phosphoglycolate phosphatase-like HAD superfamily hydrolase